MRSFRAAKMAPGRYFVAVRAIDTEEYLGVAAKRTVDVVELDLGVKNATINGDEIVANPYAAITFKTGIKTELAIDDGPFGPIPASLDLTKRAPSRMRFRPQGADAPYDVKVSYTDVAAQVSATLAKDAKTAAIEVTFRGLEEIDIPARVAPVLRTNDGKTVATSPLVAKDGRWIATVAAPAEGASLRVDVLDGRGAVLGTGNVTSPKAEAPAKNLLAEGPPIPRIGFTTEA